MTLEEKFNEAINYHQKGMLQDALNSYEYILQRNPQNFIILTNIGVIHTVWHNYDIALNFFNKAIAMNKNYFSAFNNRGLCNKAIGYFDRALEDFDRAIKLNNRYLDAYFNKGNLYLENKDYKHAAKEFQNCIKIKPNFSEALNSLALCMKSLGKLDNAINNFKLAILYNPKNYQAKLNLGNLYKDQKKDILAIEQYEDAIKVNPSYTQAFYGLGICYENIKDIDRAIYSYQKALNLDENHHDSRWNLSLLQLLKNDSSNGWKNYEARLFRDDPKKQYLHKNEVIKKPFEKNYNFKDKTIFIRAEQGLGDYIQIIRYMPEIIKMGAKLIIDPPESVEPLIKNAKIEFFREGDWDISFYMMSIPFLFQKFFDEDQIFGKYLFSDTSLKKDRSNELKLNGKKNIGLVWAGNPKHPKDKIRSMKLQELQPILENVNFNFYSLMINHSKQEIEFIEKFDNFQILTKTPENFLDTASIIDNLDLIITVDTSVAHLAGALNKEVWILINEIPDFRWKLTDNKTTLYASAKLFRQCSTWNETMKNLSSELEKT